MYLVAETLPSSVSLFTSVTAVACVVAACYGVRNEMGRGVVPAFFALTGFVLIAQLLNCSMGLGFSGYLLGGALVTVLLGPWAAMLSMAAVLLTQALLLGEGAYSTLGLNFLTIGVVTPWTAHLIYRTLQGRRQLMGDSGQLFAMGAASFVSVIMAAFFLSYLLGVQLVTILSVYAVVGILEALFSLLIFVASTRTQIARSLTVQRQFSIKPIVLAVVIGLCLLPYRSQLYVLEISTGVVN
jgi:cobalt/nickel transport system permease protein